MKEIRKISDKEFDDLCRRKLYSFEVEPSDTIWNGISSKINPEKRKRYFPVLWLSAASVAIMVGIGLWLSANKEPIKLRGLSDASNIAPKPAVEEMPVMPDLVAVKPDLSNTGAVKETVKKVERPAPEIESPKVTEVAKNIKSSEINEALSNTIVVKLQEPAEPTVEEKTVLTVLDNPVSDVPEADEQIKERVNTVGSLVNFVVSKVDKRKDKIIKFEESREGTMVSGLNFGVLKFKAKPNK